MKVNQIVGGLTLAFDCSIPVDKVETESNNVVSGVNLQEISQKSERKYYMEGEDATGVPVVFSITCDSEMNPEVVSLLRGENLSEYGEVTFCQVGSDNEEQPIEYR